MDNPPESKLVLSVEGTRVLIEVVGEGSIRQATGLKRFSEETLAQGLSDFTIELKDCSALDSTFLGILLGLGLKVKQRYGRRGQVRVMNARPEVARLMKDLGLDRLFAGM
jgi:anti-sigma B factor antagonist